MFQEAVECTRKIDSGVMGGHRRNKSMFINSFFFSHCFWVFCAFFFFVLGLPTAHRCISEISMAVFGIYGLSYIRKAGKCEVFTIILISRTSFTKCSHFCACPVSYKVLNFRKINKLHQTFILIRCL